MKRSNYTFFLLLALIFSFTACKNVDEELKKDGVIVRGRIVDGQVETSRSLRRSRSKRVLKVSFTTKEKENYVKETTVDENTYQVAFKGKEVQVSYSKSDPNVFKIITKENAKQFMNVEQRNLGIKDFKNFLDTTIKDSKDIKSKLDKIQYGWDISKDQRSSDGTEFVNTEEQTELYIIPKKVIVYAIKMGTSNNGLEVQEFKREPTIFVGIDKSAYTTETINEAMKEQLPADLKDLKVYYKWNGLSVFSKLDIKDNVSVYYVWSMNF